MNLDRLETLSAITFIEPAIPTKSETGKNCLFIRVDGDNLILTGGGLFVTKKVILVRPAAEELPITDKKPTPKTFMIPLAEVLAFKEMMKAHKGDCIKLAKNDPSHLFVTIDDKKLTSYDGEIVYQQPKFEFKDLESVFQIIKEAVSELPMMAGDITAAMKGFRKSEKVEITFTGDKNPIHFQQGDYEALVIPPVEKEEDDQGGEQTTTDGNE